MLVPTLIILGIEHICLPHFELVRWALPRKKLLCYHSDSRLNFLSQLGKNESVIHLSQMSYLGNSNASKKKNLNSRVHKLFPCLSEGHIFLTMLTPPIFS